MEVGGMNLIYIVLKHEESGIAHALWAASHVGKKLKGLGVRRCVRSAMIMCPLLTRAGEGGSVSSYKIW